MRKRLPLLLIALVAGLAVPLSAALAQGDLALDKLYQAPDGGFAFAFPHEWRLSVADDNVVQLSSLTGAFFVDIAGPEAYDITYSVPLPVDRARATMALRMSYDIGDLTPLTVGDLEAAQYTYITGDGDEGYLLVVALAPGVFVYMDVVYPNGFDEALDVTMLALAATFTTEGQVALPETPPTLVEEPAGAPETLDNMGGGWQAVVGELEDTGLIGSGGSLVFQEDYAFFSGTGYWFTPLARNRPFADIVMAGQLEFTPSTGSEFDACMLIARTRTGANNDAVAHLDIGLTNDGLVFLSDYDEDRDDEDRAFELSRQTVPLDAPHDILFIAQGDQLTVYVDGELMMEAITVFERTGTYGISLLAQGAGASCQGHDIWVYEVPFVEPGVCEVRVSGNVNRRGGPGTDNPVAGQVTPGQNPHVSGQAEDAAGYTWWQLEDGGWVREDVVNAVGDCRSVPVVAP